MFKVIARFGLPASVFALLTASTVFADDPPEPSVFFKGTGRVRDGIMAIGGETTGTTLTTPHATWELQIGAGPNREFVNAHNKQSVTVVGRVQRVAGVERPARWIVNVEDIALAAEDVKAAATQIVAVGRLEAIGDLCGSSSSIAVRVYEQTWPLTFAENSRFKSVAETSVGLTVRLSGHVESALDSDRCAPGTIHVAKLEKL